jgi:hypothetical protein
MSDTGFFNDSGEPKTAAIISYAVILLFGVAA